MDPADAPRRSGVEAYLRHGPTTWEQALTFKLWLMLVKGDLVLVLCTLHLKWHYALGLFNSPPPHCSPVGFGLPHLVSHWILLAPFYITVY